jgi:hypothetical protein
VTPSKLKTIPFEETCKISRDYATTAIQTLDALRHKQDGPLRFIYMSGHFAPRTPAEVPKELQDHGLTNYGLLRVCMDERVGGRTRPFLPVFLSCLPLSPSIPHVNANGPLQGEAEAQILAYGSSPMAPSSPVSSSPGSSTPLARRSGPSLASRTSTCRTLQQPC